ncbi:CSE2-domain-containing protein [Suhomyces tanzawaensis NRRL Y-17324]|uniref:Mediator of RNA polymerase II transcription subunit 21 n=1 Tax=Suhomyces tanzawaensis NRRL Y-17324 TaxID=984487 RepID=A0A1E4SNK9_9ASCO|nr:CSE2-domain-containing protein [Suhomyces tanzawaensis NRRL Y-17324]ODV81103.1 CSE2-domain-containing protein [Suhomyces tanzawaensis NRRL Y-17324]
MADRLTQLQTCLDQLVEQFNATVNYVNTHSEPALLDDDSRSVINMAAAAPVPGQHQEQDNSGQALAGAGAKDESLSAVTFDNTITELSTDIILKSRQISMLIDSLPGIGVSPESQMQIIEELTQELEDVENQRVAKIEEKDKLLKWVESLIAEVATGISETKR